MTIVQQDPHERVAQTLQETLSSIALGDWRSIDKEALIKMAGHVRTVKAQYLVSHLVHRIEMQRELLSPLDHALVSLYLLMDLLEGKDIQHQQEIYQALQETQASLLLASSLLPFYEPESNQAHLDHTDEYDEYKEGSDVQEPEALLCEPSLDESPVSHQRQKRHSWTLEQTEIIQKAIETKQESHTANALGLALSQQYHWPERATISKVYEIVNKQKKSTSQGKSRERQQPEPHAKEEDRSTSATRSSSLSTKREA